MSGNLSASSSIEQDNGIVDEKENVRHILQYECSAYNHHIITGLSQLRDDILLCDLVLVAKVFLKKYDTVPHTQMREEIEIVDMDASTLDALVTFCYTGRIKISESNVRCLLPAACLLQMNEVKDVVHSEEFQQLSVDRLVEVISCEKLNVRSENQVFTAVLEWVKFDLAARKQFLPRILEHVRLSFCHPTFLADTISKDELVMTDVACRDFVDEAR
ncbi:BTB And Kelch, partial [Teladorsagia circumcincta]